MTDLLKEMLEQVRISGRTSVGEGIFLRDMLPIIYSGECVDDEYLEYMNSGGRSILFKRGGRTYRVKGVDPYGELTKHVTESKKNRIHDTETAEKLRRLQEGGDELMHDGRPFGVLTHKNAEQAKKAHKKLNQWYERLGIRSPCKFVCNSPTDVEIGGDMTYQTLFELPSYGSDLRVREFTMLMAEKLDQLTPEEIENKSKNINRLYGRFIYWAGINTALMIKEGLLPIESSFCEQNWVVSPVRDGYGIFRVDHTSTKRTDQKTASKSMLSIRETGVPVVLDELSVVPERVQVASHPEKFYRDDRPRKFTEILLDDSYQGDPTQIIEAHKKVFVTGMQSAMEGKTMPIPEEMFLKALE